MGADSNGVFAKSRRVFSLGGGSLIGLLVLAAGCAGTAGDAEDEGATPGIHSSALAADNGLVTNGLVTNGLVTNGLVTNGLSKAAFSTWFNQNPADFSNMVMHYLVACALPAGQSLSWMNPSSRQTYTWSGNLGLTPGWAAGAPATEVEQQLITACLAVHVNRYGVHDVVSVQGKTSAGALIPSSVSERAEYSEYEACFFGNLFNGDGVFAANDRNRLTASASTSRGCGLTSDSNHVTSECAPMLHVGACEKLCTLDASGLFYTSCKWNGKSYKPLTTRLPPSEFFNCGDNVCQFTESCGAKKTSTPSKLRGGLRRLPVARAPAPPGR